MTKTKNRRPETHEVSSLASFVGKPVVLDTAGPIIYLGTLREIREDGYWLDEADVHDCRDGHAHKELYVCESRRDGVRSNRKSVFVFREAVLSASKLEDVVAD